jgi:sec-independent protein translocase protein TatA
MNSLMFAMFGMPGPMEMLIILAIFLLLFGGRQLPSLMRNLGASAREFKKGVQGMDEELDEATRSLKDDKSE